MYDHIKQSKVNYFNTELLRLNSVKKLGFHLMLFNIRMKRTVISAVKQSTTRTLSPQAA